jgi:cell division protein ZipA
MGALRWILLALGALLIAALWWWELKRSRPERAAGEPRSLLRQEPQLGAAQRNAERGESASSMRAAYEDRPVPGTSPPVITLEDLPADADVVLAPPSEALVRRPVARAPEPERALRREPKLEPEPERQAEPEPELDDDTIPPGMMSAKMPATPIPVPSGVGAPAGASQARESGEARGVRAAARRDSPPRATADSANEQKIVAIRLVAPADRIEGLALRAALESEGLEFGRYAVFHRQRSDGRVLYSVASLLEPGSFDLERMAAQRFPGISIFAVFPGPVDAPQAFDDMLATARRLAERLGGVLQDERGSSMTAQRVLSLREELVHFQHVVARMRARSPS